MGAAMSRVQHWLPNDDLTDVSVVSPSGTGTATPRDLTAEEVTELAEREKRRVPLGFAPPKPKRKRGKA